MQLWFEAPTLRSLHLSISHIHYIYIFYIYMYIYMFLCMYTHIYICTHKCMYVYMQCLFCVLREWYTEVKFRRVILELRVATVSCVESLECLFTTLVLEEREYGAFVQGQDCADFEKWLHCESLDNSYLPDRQLLPQKAICFYVRFSFSNHFSFQRHSIHTSELFLGILFQLQVIFSIGNYLYFRKKRLLEGENLLSFLTIYFGCIFIHAY